jgi:hypothetical protein
MKLSVAAHADGAQAVPFERLAALAHLVRPEIVRVEVLEEALHGPDLDVLEACLGEPEQRLLEPVRLEADGRARLDPPHRRLLSLP